MLSLDVIDDMLNRLSGRRTMTEPTLDKTLEKSRELARRISLDVMDMSDGKLPFDRQQMENELTEALVVFAHECLHDDARAALAAAEKDESELVAALTEITEHFMSVLRGPVVSQHVRFTNGIENVPTIKNARALIAKHAAPPSKG